MSCRWEGSEPFPALKISGQTEILAQLFNRLEQAFATLGYLPDNRKFNPHLTLGRVRSPRGREKLSLIIQELIMPTFPVFRVSELVLFRSTLTPHGAFYTPLQTIHLGGEDKCQKL
ncbi:MAG: hypothetical protein JRG72_07375 [Deltaproteobacteria bacterium]|nr:hypothetical protein [Deltaproteobacteria bacterium]